jgi:hypothetical protein
MKRPFVIISITAVLFLAGYCMLNWYVTDAFSLALPGTLQPSSAVY